MDVSQINGTCPMRTGDAGALFLAAISILTQLQCEIGDTSIYPQDKEPGAEYDFIIVGSGSAGSVVANRLSATKQWKVLLVEAGDDPPYTSDVPGLYFSLQNSEIDWKYRTDGDGDYCLGMVNHQCSWPRGKVLGGSSVMNGLTYFRGHPDDYKRWADDGNYDWNYDHLIRHFERSEGHDDKGDGHLILEKFDGGESSGDLPLLPSLIHATRERGYMATLEYNVVTYPGFYNSLAIIGNGTRFNTAKAYLSPIKSRKNLEVVKKAFARKINLEEGGKKALSIEYEKNGSIKTVKAKKEIIVSAGTINSAQLLMLSGIGPREHLRNMGIDSKVELPVGYNLQDHIFVPGIVASVNRGVGKPQDPQKEILTTVFEYLSNRKGKLTGVGYTQFTGFVYATNMSPYMYPEIQIQFIGISKGDLDTLSRLVSAIGYNDEIHSSYMSLVNEADLLIIAPTMIHPESRGRLTLRSKDPYEHPQIRANYFKMPYDVIAMMGGIAESMEILRRLSNRGDFRIEPRVLLKECLKGNKRGSGNATRGVIDDSHLLTQEYWLCVMKKIATTDYHPVGTCKMGTKDSVVDARLRVHGVTGLRVIDASVMPTITSGNINGPVVMIGEKGSSMIIDDWL